MPLSSAALLGIEYYGHKWRLEISLRGQPQRLADEDSLRVGDCVVIRDTIVAQLRRFLASPLTFRTLNGSAVEDFENAIDELAGCADDPDELKAALAELYDHFDYHRVCVVA